MITKFFVLFLLLMPITSACGWFTYEDIPETRVYYNIQDNIEGVEDSTLLMTRFPTTIEKTKNVYIPMNTNG